MTKHAQLTQCKHCDTPFESEEPDQLFCCSGCSYVHDLLSAEGFSKFYALKGRERILPAGASVLAPTETSWAQTLQTARETVASNDVAEATLDLQGVSCVACVWLIDTLFQKHPGSVRAAIQAHRGVITLTWRCGEFSLPAFVTELAKFGYKLGLADSQPKPKQALNQLRLGTCGGLMLNAMAFTFPRYVGMADTFFLAPTFEIIAAASATLSLLVGGSYFIQRAWQTLQLGKLHMDVPIALGIVAAWIGSVIGWLNKSPGLLYFDFVATFVFLMLLGRRMQEASADRNRRLLLRRDTLFNTAESTDIQVGHAYSVNPGAVVPVDSELLAKQASVSLEWIHGEAEPVLISEGEAVPAGAIHLGHQILPLRATQAWEGSLLARLANSPNTAVASTNTRAQTLLSYYIGTVLLLAAAGFFYWATQRSWSAGLQVAISVLVVSCPCALGVALPLATDLATSALAKVGLFVRKADLWERLSRVKSIVFDKTGTLTLDAPALRNPAALQRLEPTAALRLATLVAQSRHPIASSLRQSLARLNKFHPDTSLQPLEEPGMGIHVVDADGLTWRLRKPMGAEQGDSLFSCENIVLAEFFFVDAIRPDAAREVQLLKKRGLGISILSGDRPEKVQAMAAALDIAPEAAKAAHTPDAKAQWMRECGKHSLFIGDGANDSLAADIALVSGTPAVERSLLAEKADFYFLSRGLRPIRLLFNIARTRAMASRAALVFALLYNASVISISLAGHMNPLLAAVLMPLSSLTSLAIVKIMFSVR